MRLDFIAVKGKTQPRLIKRGMWLVDLLLLSALILSLNVKTG
jgi:hypothetical protein